MGLILFLVFTVGVNSLIYLLYIYIYIYKLEFEAGFNNTSFAYLSMSTFRSANNVHLSFRKENEEKQIHNL